MAGINRRAAFGFGAGAAALALSTARLGAQPRPLAPDDDAAAWSAERARVMELGFTEDEAKCWELIARAAAKFFELPVLSELDSHEIAEATHVFQNKLLSRPTYRRYVELARQQNAEQSRD
jgi:hypothetical protein